MANALMLVQPRLIPPLDPDFRPAILANRAFQKEVADSGVGVSLVLGLERANGELSRFETQVFPSDHPRAAANLMYVERLVKFLLWQRGGWRVYVGGPREIGEYIAACYAPDGVRKFDYHFMGEDVYEQTFTVTMCAADEVPPANESGRALGRHLDGCRIGFDLGASDRKVSAVVDGQPVYSEEVVWEPRKQTDPDYHYREIMTALKTAASKMPRVDAIGGSSAGIYINNRPMIASLFRGIPKERFGEIKDLFLRIQQETGRAAGGDQRRRCDRAGRIDVAGRQRHPGHRAGLERGGGLRGPERPHRQLAERAGLCPDRLPPERAARRVVGRHRLRLAVLLAAVRLPSRAQGGHHHSARMSPMPRS